MRFQYLHVLGCLGEARLKGVVVKDTESNFLFFLTKDHRLHDAGWVFGGIPISLCDDENWWNNVCRYNLGSDYALNDFGVALRNTGCGTLAQFESWGLDPNFPADVTNVNALTTEQMDALLSLAITGGDPDSWI